MTAVHEVSALLDAIDREARDSLPSGCTADALRDLVEAIDRLMTEPLQVTDAMVLEAIAARMLPAVQRAAEALGVEP